MKLGLSFGGRWQVQVFAGITIQRKHRKAKKIKDKKKESFYVKVETN